MKAQIEKAILKYGEPIELTTAADKITRYITASVQVPVADALVNDADLTGFLVYVRPSDVPVVPQKFDRVFLRGYNRSVEEVEIETLSGITLAYILRVRG